ncbi:cytochrome c oxidase subunit II [Stutzerimonas stutzeri]|jgi:cytochrome c oxidase subunit II|uniref:cytochrome-c oxidase n=1 Tax=Stutzerimonas stutzeri TaxID=316 RepID=A0A5S5BI00_STUST|nr:cytochrome c oxidase subunit II [Stutzerimonas stutzeri]TYP66038.1 cytochrome c oxidase subunit 2 [Stutzerimonas stutzeri]
MNDDFLRLWPQTASEHANSIDWLIWSFTGMMTIFVVPVFVLTILFAIRYRKGTKVRRDHRPRGSMKVEMTWIVLPFIGSMIIYLVSAKLYYEVRTPPVDAMEIQVVAKQWMWKFQHPGGQREINTLHVPVGRPVRLNMISQDVIHSLYFPALRIKQDLLPGRYTELWFNATEAGRYEVFCAEYCGTDHSKMLATLIVQPPQEYARWLSQAGASESLAEQGEVLFRQFGCSGCHGPAAVAKAPKLDGLYGRRVALENGSSVVADQAYIRDSILLPHKQIVAGYESIMPSFANVIDEEGVLRLTAYIQSLGKVGHAPGTIDERGQGEPHADSPRSPTPEETLP